MKTQICSMTSNIGETEPNVGATTRAILILMMRVLIEIEASTARTFFQTINSYVGSLDVFILTQIF